MALPLLDVASGKSWSIANYDAIHPTKKPGMPPTQMNSVAYAKASANTLANLENNV